MITLGLVLAGFAFYLAESSIFLRKRFYEEVQYNDYKAEEALRLENRIKSIQELDDSRYHYASLELNQIDLMRVNDCMQGYLEENTMSGSCKDDIIDLMIDDKGKGGFIEAVIGHSINYYSFSIGSRFPRDLFGEEVPLSSKLILHFLNRYRNPEKLQEEFDTYKNYFYNKTPKTLYDKIFDEYIAKLLSSYQEIESKEDKEAYFKEIYFKAETQHLHSKYWEVTFWKRRALEKNDAVLYKILTEIKGHYKQQ